MRDDLPHIAWPDHWSVPGGGCDPGEDPGTAIVRELEEEAYAGLLHKEGEPPSAPVGPCLIPLLGQFI
ncbi:NUDIX domain-containing protein [Streptomyces sp. NPDC002855]|uniref:NUDIX domain-containing protein n=1 Tax=Streptomyces sp. NPDC002855 TaxID=3154437 RepID=UPI003333A345